MVQDLAPIMELNKNVACTVILPPIQTHVRFWPVSEVQKIK